MLISKFHFLYTHIKLLNLKNNPFFILLYKYNFLAAFKFEFGFLHYN